MALIACSAAISCAYMRDLLSLGMATARMIRMIAITISNSISEKPNSRRVFFTAAPSPTLYDAVGALFVQEIALDQRVQRFQPPPESRQQIQAQSVRSIRQRLLGPVMQLYENAV